MSTVLQISEFVRLRAQLSDYLRTIQRLEKELAEAKAEIARLNAPKPEPGNWETPSCILD